MAVDKCFVPSDQLYRLAIERNLRPDQLVQHGLPIRKGFWGMDGHIEGTFTSSRNIPTASTLEKNPSSKNPLLKMLGSFVKKRGNMKQTSPTLSPSNSNDNKSVFREKLGLECDVPAVLVVGGGDGMGKSALLLLIK